MTTVLEVLEMLLPAGGYVVVGDTYEGIQWYEAEPITKAELEEGFKIYNAWKKEQDEIKFAARESAIAKLLNLGLTLDDLKALGL